MDAIRYTEENRDGKIVDVLTNESSGLRLMIARVGAEPVSLARIDTAGKWHGFLHNDGDLNPPAGPWPGHSTVMGYYIHRLLNQESTYRGRHIHGGTHSFIRHKTFAAPLVGERSLTYRVDPDQIPSDAYPFRLAMDLTYSIEGDTWRTTFQFTNQEKEETTHFSFGLHPGFAAQSMASWDLNMPPGTYLRHVAPGNFLSGEIVEIRHPGGPMPFPKSELPGSFILELKNVPVPLFVFTDRASGREVDMNYTGAPYLTIWSDGNPYVCVEPCWGLPDHHEQRPFDQKEGIQVLAPGEVFTRSFTITPRLI